MQLWVDPLTPHTEPPRERVNAAKKFTTTGDTLATTGDKMEYLFLPNEIHASVIKEPLKTPTHI